MELLEKLSGPQLLALGVVGTGVLGIVVIAVTALLSKHGRRLREAELDAGLKHKMLDLGMSADEICQVLSARGEAGEPKSERSRKLWGSDLPCRAERHS